MGGGADSSMHLSSRRELGHKPTGPLWPKGLRGPPRPLLPLRIEVGWIRLPSANRKRYSFNLDQRAGYVSVFCGQTGKKCLAFGLSIGIETKRVVASKNCLKLQTSVISKNAAETQLQGVINSSLDPSSQHSTTLELICLK